MNEKIALGFGNNIDYEIVWDSPVFEALIVCYEIHDAELAASRAINSERDLIISILSFLKSGTGGERTVASPAIIEHFSQRFEKRITLGGTSVRAALAMGKLGYTSALHLVTMNEHVRRLMPKNCPYVCSNPEESLYPHLIVQFEQGTLVRAGDIHLSAHRANRIIYLNDDDNRRMYLDARYADLITNAQVFLISGFNAMQDEALLNHRMMSLKRLMKSLPANAQVYYEDAGFHNPRFSRLIFRTLAQHIHIVSLNEDELQSHLERKIDMLDAEQIKTALAELREMISTPVIVVHSMYWALAYGDNALAFGDALKGGITMATTRFCYGDEFTMENYREIETLNPNRAGADFANDLNELLGESVCCLPVVQVEQANATTVGLGDAFVGGFLSALLES